MCNVVDRFMSVSFLHAADDVVYPAFTICKQRGRRREDLRVRSVAGNVFLSMLFPVGSEASYYYFRNFSPWVLPLGVNHWMDPSKTSYSYDATIVYQYEGSLFARCWLEPS